MRNNTSHQDATYTAVQVQSEGPVLCKARAAATLTRTHVCGALRREASPGKLGAFEDDLFRNAEMADVPVAAAIILGYPEGARTIGIAFCDAAGRALGACEYADDEYFCNTESVLVQLGAKEVVLPKASPWTKLHAHMLPLESCAHIYAVRHSAEGRLIDPWHAEQHR